MTGYLRCVIPGCGRKKDRIGETGENVRGQSFMT